VDFLFERFATAPDRAAFIDAGRRVSYGELLAATDAFGARLHMEGIARGDIVVVLGDYAPELVALLLALARNGNVIVPLTRASVIAIDDATTLAEAQWTLDYAEGEVVVTRLDTVVTNPLLARLRATGHPGVILFTSGSTGTPKAILHDLALVADKFRRPGPSFVAIAFLMLDHFGGINTILAILSGLGTVVTVADRSVVTICGAIAAHGVEVLPTTPTFLTALVRSDALARFDLGSLRRITYGTEVMPQATLDRVRAAFPDAVLQQTYGLSEVGVLRSRSREDGSLWVRVGGDGFATRIEGGILWVKSNFAMLGYLNAPDPFDADGWFNTGDRVEVDGEWLRILGRDSDLINVGGQKVYPAEVEQAILELDNIRDVVVCGERHPLLGQAVVARVATVEPEPADILKLRIRRSLAGRMAAFMLPTKVIAAEAEDLRSVRFKKQRQLKAAS
jgi:acyl-CoA synthetase (AMP-forming)/AMP-acid ligase II